MKKITLILLLFLSFTLLHAAKIRVELATAIGQLYLAGYKGAGVEVLDSSTLTEGVVEWIFDQNLKEGVYFITDASRSRFEFLLGKEQEVVIKLDDLDSKSGELKGAKDSELFFEYLQVMKDDAKPQVEKINYAKSLLLQAPEGSMLGLVLQAVTPVVGTNKDNSYENIIKHYWGNYDLNDERIVRTPFFVPTVNHFLRKVLLPREDIIVPAMLDLLNKVDRNEAALRIVANAAMNFAVENTVMGIDALGYEVITRYYLTGRMGQLPEKHRKMLRDYVVNTEKCRVGQVAQDIRLDAWEKDLGEVSLFEIKAPYTLVLFWEPNCDYCKEVIPVLRDEIYSVFSQKGLCIFAVNTQDNYQEWSTFILDSEIDEWSHAYSANGERGFMIDYGVPGTPYIYILDEDKCIVAKNVKLDFAYQMLERLFAIGSIY